VKKIQGPSSKIQGTSKPQAPITRRDENGSGVWTLKLPSGLHLGLMARGFALFLGGFALMNVIGGWMVAGFDANIWWIDLRWVPAALRIPFLLVSALCLLGFGLRPPSSRWRNVLTGTCAGLLGIAALVNVGQFYVLLARRHVHDGLPIPLSLIGAAALAFVLAACIKRQADQARHRGLVPSLAICAGFAFVFPLAQMLFFGKTDYRRPADVAVVLGARVYADGRASDALADRVRTACQLYRAGLARKLLFSGGPGDGAFHETEGMKRVALSLGVKAEDILVDDAGRSTQATVRNTEAICSRLHFSRILVVSHFYHLPRIKLAYQRDGWEVFTVPAKESYLLRQMPYNMAREVAALWIYYLRPLTASGAGRPRGRKRIDDGRKRLRMQATAHGVPAFAGL